jgi:hypothetical protein
MGTCVHHPRSTGIGEKSYRFFATAIDADVAA